MQFQIFRFVAKPGTAIIGGTGSGKSSILNMIPRFYDAAKGLCSSLLKPQKLCYLRRRTKKFVMLWIAQCF